MACPHYDIYKPERYDKDISPLSHENPRYGYRRMWALLKREGWVVNRKRVQRLWREAEPKVPAKKVRKRRRMGDSENSTMRKRADHVNHVWSYNFAVD